ncbi:GyrI-like domain-containing protein [Nocardia sp. NBC_01503]|uniref:GyrI-like domain-containing protein n=1 Tax=Nocardia sp. NBC_01503 TaxID=2975997 RepID=UPI002E7B4324|nr:GyrI-like domain-containing protein [Nocardia sp. NBC_01503]WTL33009.1 GyrI-like domain-containing protein [Nocardia sp. NBC_01503]
MKLDLAKTDRNYYTAPADPVLRTFGTHCYATVTGSGAPLGRAYTEAVATLYRAAYGAKKLAKAADQDFVVAKLEGLWWVESDAPPLTVAREQWHWKMMIRLPEFITADMVTGATFEELTEGESIQALHVGPYSTEPETLSRMDAFMRSEGLTMNGRHHEIYLSDPRKSAEATMKTILRHPVRRLT